MRSIHKSWQNKRPGWTRRVRWYDDDYGMDVRLELTDEYAELNCYYRDSVSAQVAYDRFRAGESTQTLFAEQRFPVLGDR